MRLPLEMISCPVNVQSQLVRSHGSSSKFYPLDNDLRTLKNNIEKLKYNGGAGKAIWMRHGYVEETY
jgi:hypothetical protein